MNESLTLRHLRTFLIALSVALFLGTIAELILVGHAKTPAQWIPFVLCGLGMLALAAFWMRPSRRTVGALRVAMAIVAVGALVGIVQHILGNLELARETQPNADATRLLITALTHGSPIFAPGVLAVTAALSVAATYSAGEKNRVSHERRPDPVSAETSSSLSHQLRSRVVGKP